MIEFVAGWKLDDSGAFAGAPFLILAPDEATAQAIVASLRHLPSGRRAALVGALANPSTGTVKRSVIAAVTDEIAAIFNGGR